MTAPIAILLGIIVLAVLGFAMWYINTQAQRLAAQNRATGSQQIAQGIGEVLGGALSFIH